MSVALMEKLDRDVQETEYKVSGTYEYVPHDEVVKMTSHFIEKHREALEALANA